MGLEGTWWKKLGWERSCRPPRLPQSPTRQKPVLVVSSEMGGHQQQWRSLTGRGFSRSDRLVTQGCHLGQPLLYGHESSQSSHQCPEQTGVKHMLVHVGLGLSLRAHCSSSAGLAKMPPTFSFYYENTQGLWFCSSELPLPWLFLLFFPFH